MDTLFEQLQQHSFAHIDHPVSPTLTKEAIAILVRVLEEVPEQRLWDTHYPLPYKNSTPLGYTTKEGRMKLNRLTGREEWEDAKILFQSDRTWPSLPVVRELARTCPTFDQLCAAIVALLEAYEPIVANTIRALAREYPLYETHCFRDGIMPQLVIRLVAYKTVGGRVFAAGHYDKGAHTFTVCESAPGLHIQTRQGEIYAPELVPSRSLLMVGHHAHHTLTNGAFQKTWHWVNQPVGHALTERFGRVSIVLFADTLPERTENPSYQETHAVHA